MDFMDAVMQRRSVYRIGGEATVGDEALQEMLGKIALNTPTAYDMRSTRLVLLLGQEHQQLWDIVLGSIRKHSTKGVSEGTIKKIGSFAAGHGSVLYFDDTAVTKRYMEENPAYSQNFEPWALQQNGMLQYAVWAALRAEGMGASLQHYNPIIDDEVKRRWQLPVEWMLLAQMPFGIIEEAPAPKDRGSVQDRIRVFGG